MKYVIEQTDFSVPSERDADWTQLTQAEIVHGTDSHEEAVDRFKTFRVNSYTNHGKDTTMFQRPASVKVVSLLEHDGTNVSELDYKYLVKI
jgi:hypothetical protein